MERIQSLPDASRTLTGLAHQGYTPQTAIADIIDNSIAAGATLVDVVISPQPNNLAIVRITDNGSGMDGETLKSAMQIGSPKGLAKTSLSVYGMGLKAASMSFSRRFSVVSRASGQESVVAIWDMDAQVENPWTIEFGVATDAQVKALSKVIGDNPGTMVVWDKADFKDVVLDHRKIKGTKPTSVDESVKKYLAKVFHRYMEGKADGYSHVEIRFNGEPLSPFDPVRSDFLSIDWVPVKDSFEIEIDTETGPELVPYSITTYVLAQGEDEVKEADLSMRTQGIYPYRQDRLLQESDWLGVIAFHPDLNSMRVILDLDPRLDSITRTDMKKSGLTLPKEMLQNLKEKLEEYSKMVKREKKRKVEESRKKRDTSKIHQESNAAISASLASLEQPQFTLTKQGASIETIFGPSLTELPEVFGTSYDQEARILPVESIDGGVLFEPRSRGGESVIYLNKSHPFYQKIYLACLGNLTAIQGFDFLIYSVSHAELLTRTDRHREQFRRMRTEMSEALRHFVLDLETPGDDADSALDQNEERLL